MAQVKVSIGGNVYTLACRDGEESRLERLAHYVDRKTDDLTQTLGRVPESRLMLMAALLITDELQVLKDQMRSGEASSKAADHARPDADGSMQSCAADMDLVSLRLDKLKRALEAAANNA